MSRSQAVRTGFTAILKQPAVLTAELSWRWAFAIACWMLGIYALLLFLQSLPVSDSELFGLYDIIPGTFGFALASIFKGSGPKMARILIVLAMGASLLWWLAASTGRMATLRALMPGRDGNFTYLFRLHGLRVMLALAAALSYVGAVMLAVAYAQQAAGGHSAANFRLVFWPLAISISIAWSWLSWYLTLAPVVSVWNGTSAVASLMEAAELSRARGSQFAWVSFFFGALRFAMWICGFFTFFFVLSIALQLPAAAGIILLAVSAALYSLLATFLHLARMAAYVRVVEWEPQP